MSSTYSWLDQAIKTIKKANWYRSVKLVERSGAMVEQGGVKLINFASNDYLGLAGDRRLVDAAVAATVAYGTGSTGSRLLSGHRAIHQELEAAIANFKQTEAALVFSSGYLANLGTITALVDKRDLILADEYNHSSLKNGAKLSEATVCNYCHGDIEHLYSLLQQHRHQFRRCLIVSDSVFSMDGDLCPLPQLLDLAEANQAMLLIDEAHATGVIGKRGSGCVEYFGCRGRELIQTGTLSKALGSLGGYVAGSASLIDYLRNRASSWIYTTGLSPADTAAAAAAIKIICSESERIKQLWRNINYIKPHLQKYRFLSSDSAILCIELDRAKTALELEEKLKQWGVWAAAIRPPTAPTSRLRLSIMATHTESQLQQLAAAMEANLPTR